MRKPLIGITCNFDYRDDIGVVAHLGCEGEEWQFLSNSYISSVEKAGGIPIIIPICDCVETVEEVAERLDGFLISGGNDIDPRRICWKRRKNRFWVYVVESRYLMWHLVGLYIRI